MHDHVVDRDATGCGPAENIGLLSAVVPEVVQTQRTRVGTDVVDGLGDIWSTGKEVWGTTKDVAGTIWGGVKDAASGAWDFVKDVGSTAWDLGKTAINFTGIGKLGGLLKGGASKVLGWLGF